MHVVLLLIAIQTQDYSTASLERRASRVGVWATVIPVVAGTALATTSRDDGGGALVATMGLLIGPALGYQEASLGGRGWRGAALRSGLLLGSFAGAMAVCGWYCTNDQEQGARWLLGGGLALVTASAIYDLSRLRHNIRRREATRRLSFAPFYAPHERRGGFSAHFSF